MLDVLLRSGSPTEQRKKSQSVVKKQLERFTKTQQLYEQKKAERAKALEQAEIEKCTFQPEIKKKQHLHRAGSAGCKPRSFQDFLKSQEEHKKKVEDKIRREQEEKAEQKDEELRDLQINPKSRDMVEKKRRKQANTRYNGSPPLDTFERLFQRKPSLNVQNALERKTATSLTRGGPSMRTPKSEKKGQTKVLLEERKNQRLNRINERKGITSHLYQDALRRQKKQEEAKTQKKQEHSTVASQKSQQVLRSRFLKDFRDAVELCLSRSIQLFSANHSSLKSTQKVNFMQTQEILRVLGYIRDQYPEEEKQLIQKMWKVIARTKDTALLKDLQIFLESVQGVLILAEKKVLPFGDILRQNESKNEKRGEKETLGHYEDGAFTVSEKEYRRIQREFNIFVLNRREHVFAQKAIQKLKTEDCSFHPAVNQESERILRNQDSQRQKNTIARLTKVAEVKQREEQPDLNCTFKPKTNTLLKERPHSGGAQKKRWETLYQNAKTISYRQERREKEREEERGIKEKQQCTFQPQLLTKSNTFQKRASSSEGTDGKDIEEFVRRMERAREKNAAVKQAMEKGWTLDKVIRGSQLETKNRKIPEQLKMKPKTRRVIKRETEKPKREEMVVQDLKSQESHVTIPESAIELQPQNSDKQFDLENSQLEQLLEIENKSIKEEQKEKETELDPEEVQRIKKTLEELGPSQPFEPPLQEEVNLPAAQEDFRVPTHQLQRKVSGGFRPSEMHGGVQFSQESEREPVLYVDVNLGSGVSKRITVYEGDTAEQLASKFALEHSLDEGTKDKLIKLLQSQMNQLLTKIEEGQSEDYEESQREDEGTQDSLPSAEEGGFEGQTIEQKYLSPESGSECIKEQIQSDQSNGQASPQHNQSESESVAVVSPTKIKF